MSKTVSKIPKDKIMSDINRLSPDHVREVLDFISYLKAKESLKATKEILEDEDFVEAIKRGEEDFGKGDYESWEDIKATMFTKDGKVLDNV